SPAVETSRLRLTIKKVQIVLAHEEGYSVNRVRSERGAVVVRNDGCGYRLPAKLSTHRIAQKDVEELITFCKCIVNEGNMYALAGFTRRKVQRPGSRSVIRAVRCHCSAVRVH